MLALPGAEEIVDFVETPNVLSSIRPRKLKMESWDTPQRRRPAALWGQREGLREVPGAGRGRRGLRARAFRAAVRLGGLGSALRNGAFGCCGILCKYPTRRVVDTLTCVMNKGIEASI